MSDTDLIRQLLERHYGIRAEVESLAGERDLNFRVRADDGAQYVAKLMHAGCPEPLVDMQCQALAAIGDCPLNLPRPIPSSDGRLYETVASGSETRLLWLLSWCPGTLLAEYRPHGPGIWRSFGTSLARLTVAMDGLDHPAAHRGHQWELSRAADLLALVDHIDSPAEAPARRALQRFRDELAPQLQALPHALVHNDANDYNVLVDCGAPEPRVNGLFDFGDMSWQPVICDVAIALAYLIMGQSDPLAVCRHFLQGYCELRPLSKAEVKALWQLIETRLAVSLAISSERQVREPQDPYITISQAPARQALLGMQAIAPGFAHCALREAAGFEALPQLARRSAAIAAVGKLASPVIEGCDWSHIIDLSIGSTLLGADPADAELAPLTRRIAGQMADAGVSCAVGRYAEPLGIYNAAAFGDPAQALAERRTEHLGIDLFCAPGTAVHAPLDATVELLADNDRPLDYGPLVVLRHEDGEGGTFFSLYGHLARHSVRQLQVGQELAAGEAFAAVGADSENGGWTPHLHLQLILDLLQLGADYPGVAAPSQAPLWRKLSPNAALLLPGADPQALDARPNPQQLQRRRGACLPRSLALSYSEPLHIVRGFRQYLYDSEARAYLDMYNNVAHVGHSHPQVVRAAQDQLGLLNTNTRYLHDNILDYAESLTALLPEPLSVCAFVNSASEANELALRMARRYTGARDLCVVEAAYHGHTSALTEMSPYKYNGPGGEGPAQWIHEVPLADDYRGRYRRDCPDAGQRYAADIGRVMDAAQARGRGIAGFIAETLPSVGGQIVPPAGYLASAYSEVRARGGLCIADEVQVGFGRLGDSFWGFESQRAIPDIVVLGKPIANGFPLGAVITTPEIAAAFDNGMEFFSTFGGNPVACAAGLAVLQVLQQERLQDNAQQRGQQLLQGLRELQQRHHLIGDVRGRGLFIGVELVRDRQTLEPAATEAAYVVDRLRQRRILAGTDGPLHNVIKLRPTMVVQSGDIDLLLQALDETLAETRYLPTRAS